jgi:drug/metabolite transporter (DMT)-like permease
MDIRAFGMGLLFALMWSSAFTSARMIVVDAPPLTALAFRFLFSGIIGVGLALAMGQTWRLTRAQWRATLIFGLCQNALYLGLNFVAMTRVEASLAAIIASTMPLMVAFFGWALFREKLRPAALIGLICGVIGVGIIMGSRISGGTDIGYVGLCFIAALALTIATLSVRGAATGGNVMMIVGMQMFVGSALLAVSALMFETWTVNWNPRLIGAFAYTTLVPGVLATWIWFWLVGRIGAVKAATFHFLNPFFGVAIAALFLGERLGAADIIGVMIIAGGILAVQLSKQVR